MFRCQFVFDPHRCQFVFDRLGTEALDVLQNSFGKDRMTSRKLK